MYPIFFSVAGENVKFAEDVWESFPDDWIYLFSKTGQQGEAFWEEISVQEIPKSQFFVVFWSAQYPTKSGCVRELQQARDLIRQNRLRPIVLRLDATPIMWTDSKPGEHKSVYEALNDLITDYRTSDPNVSIAHAIDIIGRAAEPILQPQHPIWPRDDLKKALRKEIRKEKDNYNVVPAVWVSGFNGVGRESLIREFNRSFTPNGRGIVIDVSEAALPRQILLRIESEAFGQSRERLQQIADDPVETTGKSIAETVQRVFDRNDYVVFRHNRIVQENIELPEWLDDVIKELKPATRCKLFVISQLPLMSDRRARCGEALVAQRVPSLDEHEMKEFCRQLIGHFDKYPPRWTEDEIATVVAASGGNVGFLISLIRNATRLNDLDQLNTVVSDGNNRITESITIFVRWAFSQILDQDDEQKTLLFLDTVTPCHIDDLEKAIAPKRSMLRVLGRLIDLGLVEREAEGLYRLTPLLARRLNRDLVRPRLVHWLDETMQKFAQLPVEIRAPNDEDGHEYLRLESRIQALLQSGTEPLGNGIGAFISAAHWFQAGIRLYHRNRREEAYRILKKAYGNRIEFASSSRIEIARYFCLSATRNREYKDAEDCIKLLESVNSTKPIAAFLRADLHEYKREFPQAIEEYKRSLALNAGRGSRIERTYRPLIRCIVSTLRPNFKEAEEYARKYVGLRRTLFSLMSLARVYMHWKHRGPQTHSIVPSDIDELLANALSDLRLDPGGMSAFYEISSEQAEFMSNFPEAIRLMDKSLEDSPRPHARSRRWQLMIKSHDKNLALKVIDELDAARNDPISFGMWSGVLPMLADIYIRASRIAGTPIAKVNSFASSLQDSEITRIINRSKQPFDPMPEW